MSSRMSGHNHLPKECYDLISKIEYIELNNPSEGSIYEIYCINKYSPKYNVVDNRGDSIGFELPEKEWIKWKGKANYKKQKEKRKEVVPVEYQNLIYILDTKKLFQFLYSITELRKSIGLGMSMSIFEDSYGEDTRMDEEKNNIKFKFHDDKIYYCKKVDKYKPIPNKGNIYCRQGYNRYLDHFDDYWFEFHVSPYFRINISIDDRENGFMITNILKECSSNFIYTTFGNNCDYLGVDYEDVDWVYKEA